MYEITCRCGKSKKNFKMDIGKFYIDECCEKAGYDEFGKTADDYKTEAQANIDEILNSPQIDKEIEEAAAAQADEMIEEYSDEPVVEEIKQADEAPVLKSIEELEKLSVRDIKDYLSAQNIPFKKSEKDKAKLLAHLK